MPEKVLISVCVNGQSKFKKELFDTDKLPEIRKLFIHDIPKDSVFVLPDGTEIKEKDEKKYTLSEIIKDNKVYITTNDSTSSSYAIIKKKITKKAFVIYRNKPISGSKKIGKKGGLDIYLYPKYELTDTEKAKAITFIVIGQNDSGKTTLMNSFLNSYLHIQFNENFRYEIIPENLGNTQEVSQTSETNVYNIKGINGLPPIQIIVISDLEGKKENKQDSLNTDKIKNIFKEKVNGLNAVCFVAQANSTRLTENQKNIFSSIIDLFGDEIKENFIATLTSCDGEMPKIVASLEEKNCIFSSIIPHIKKPWYYKFNNSAIFSSDRKDDFTQTFFKLGMKSLEKFTNKLIKLSKKSLKKTNKALENKNNINQSLDESNKLPRKRAQTIQIKEEEKNNKEQDIDELNNKTRKRAQSQYIRVFENNLESFLSELINLKEGLNRTEYFKCTYKIIKSLKKDMNDLKNYTQEIKVPKTKFNNAPFRQFMITCMICSKICHRYCSIPDDSRIRLCDSFKYGYCTCCPNKCHWTDHRSLSSYFIDYYPTEKEKVNLNELKKKYCDSKSDLDMKTQILIGLKKELIELNIKCLYNLDLFTEKINLNRKVFESSEEHIDLLIETEKSEQNDGWEIRIEGLKLLKTQKSELKKMNIRSKSEKRKFIEESLNKEKHLDDPMSGR